MMSFLADYWLAIIVVLSVIFEVIASIVVIFNTPKNKRSKALVDCLKSIPHFINQAEDLLVGASQKKSFVLKRCVSFVADILGCSETKIEKLYLNDFSNAIEDCLSTPQKKGDA